MVSLPVSFTPTPRLSARLLTRDVHGVSYTASRGGFCGAIDRAYARLLSRSLRDYIVVLAPALPVMAVNEDDNVQSRLDGEHND